MHNNNKTAGAACRAYPVALEKRKDRLPTLPADEEREWYCVAFRSKRKEGSDSGRESLSVYYLSLWNTLIHMPRRLCSAVRGRQEGTRRGRVERRSESLSSLLDVPE